MPEIVGILGVLVYIGAYLALQLGLVGGQTYIYAALNLTAASAVLFSLSDAFNLSSAMIQLSWIAISLIGIFRLAHGSVFARFTDEEEALVALLLPGLPRHLARRFLDRGAWLDVGPGTELTVEGTPVAALSYFAAGSATARSGGVAVGRCRPGSLAGEFGCISGAPAMATVTVETPSRLFRIDAPRIRRLARRSVELRNAFDSGFAAEARRKLAAANASYGDRVAAMRDAAAGDDDSRPALAYQAPDRPKDSR